MSKSVKRTSILVFILFNLLGINYSNANLLSSYNLILQEDYNFLGGDVEGRTLIGGNLNAGNRAAEFGSRVTSGGAIVSVAGNINAQHVTVQNGGDVRHAGDADGVNFNTNGGGSVIYDPNLDFNGVFSQLKSTSSLYAGLSQNGTFDSSTKQFTYDGVDPLAIFNVSASDVFAQNSSLSLIYGIAKTVIINVSGTDIDVAGGVNLVNGFRPHDFGSQNIVWNFFEADSIDFSSIAMSGAVLAMSADIEGGAVFDGSVAAKSYTGAREFHQYLFDEPTFQSVTVPEPSSIVILIFACFAVFASNRLAKNTGTSTL